MAGALPDAPVPGHPGSLAGGGELGALVRAKDWSATPQPARCAAPRRPATVGPAPSTPRLVVGSSAP